jgi:putative ABC transport system ATP-binding protein
MALRIEFRSKPLIRCNAITKRFGSFAALHGIDLHVRPGEFVALLGPSGSGKTTLLHCIGGLIRPDAGRVTVAGRDLAGFSGGALDIFRGQTIGIVFQTLRLVRALTVAQNLELALHLARRKPDPRRIADTLARLGVDHLAGARPNRLSVGEQQRAAIARAVVAAPRLILADEPTSALDDDNAAAVPSATGDVCTGTAVGGRVKSGGCSQNTDAASTSSSDKLYPPRPPIGDASRLPAAAWACQSAKYGRYTIPSLSTWAWLGCTIMLDVGRTYILGG